MAKKVKGFKQLLNQTQPAQGKKAAERALTERFREQWGDDRAIVHEPQGQVKMSDVLETLVAPFLEEIDTPEASFGIFTMGVFGWNLALFPAFKRAAEVEKVVALLAEQNPDPQYLDDTRAILNTLIDRKLALFPKLQRHILDFELKPDGRGELYLSVMSTPDGVSPAP